MKTWTIKSTSDPTKQYQVIVTEQNEWKCTCIGYLSHKKECRHIKGVQKAYERKTDKQNPQSEPTPDGSQAAEIPSDDRGHGQERDSVQGGELRWSNIVDGESADIYTGNEQPGESGHSSSSENAETGMGTPDASTDVPRSAEGSDPTTLTIDQKIRRENDAREQLRLKKESQLKQYEAWELRETTHSADLHTRLKQLRKRWTDEPQNRSTIELMVKPINTAIRMVNRKEWKAAPDFDISLIEVDLDDSSQETAELLESIQENLF